LLGGLRAKVPAHAVRDGGQVNRGRKHLRIKGMTGEAHRLPRVGGWRGP